MSIRFRLILMNFLEFFVWGSWLISMGGYMIHKLGFSGIQVGSIYGTMGVASLFMPTLMVIVADRWLNVELVLLVSHFLCPRLLFYSTPPNHSTAMYVL